ncbi:NAD(P)H-dependent amine dehydrogenase family protein [Mycolicibacterium sp. XJ1819]
MGRLRVVQSSTGNVGRRALDAILDMPHLELVGVHVFDADKIGKDAGELVGRAPTGVIATDDVSKILAVKPDCVSYMPSKIDYDLVARFLRAGINVVTTADFLTGDCLGGQRELLDAAARSRGATFLGTGFEPGFVNLAAGFLTGACRKVQSVRIVETLDCTTYPVAAAWAAMGFGAPLTERSVTLTPETAPFAVAYFETLDLVAGMLGVRIDSRELVVEAASATRDIELGWASYPRGTVAGQRRTYRGFAQGRCIVELALCWTMSDDALDPQWSDPEGFSIEIEGEPRVEATVKYMMPLTEGLTDEADTMSLLMVSTAMAALHAIPHVCAAEPGVVLASELPVIGARHSLS